MAIFFFVVGVIIVTEQNLKKKNNKRIFKTDNKYYELKSMTNIHWCVNSMGNIN